MGPCVRCGINSRRPTHAYCCACHAKNMRNWRKSHPLNPVARAKDNCRSYANVYKRRGKITPEPCHCGASAEMHHPDYDQPLMVEWLCREHHLALHKAAT